MLLHLDNILLIDAGNTAVKWLFKGEYDSALISDFSLDLLPKSERILISCVGDKSLLEGLDKAIFVQSLAQNWVISLAKNQKLTQSHTRP